MKTLEKVLNITLGFLAAGLGAVLIYQSVDCLANHDFKNLFSYASMSAYTFCLATTSWDSVSESR